mmetsp:Transcript_10232/g.62465  ORF Transcript_10232/g.62465 Transcript_10232/m.62465 type:complete len:287 (-) Transcript_10232:2435-3295(-)
MGTASGTRPSLEQEMGEHRHVRLSPGQRNGQAFLKRRQRTPLYQSLLSLKLCTYTPACRNDSLPEPRASSCSTKYSNMIIYMRSTCACTSTRCQGFLLIVSMLQRASSPQPTVLYRSPSLVKSFRMVTRPQVRPSVTRSCSWTARHLLQCRRWIRRGPQDLDVRALGSKGFQRILESIMLDAGVRGHHQGQEGRHCASHQSTEQEFQLFELHSAPTNVERSHSLKTSSCNDCAKFFHAVTDGARIEKVQAPEPCIGDRGQRDDAFGIQTIATQSDGSASHHIHAVQ